jgi:hypothetical protein
VFLIKTKKEKDLKVRRSLYYQAKRQVHTAEITILRLFAPQSLAARKIKNEFSCQMMIE